MTRVPNIANWGVGEHHSVSLCKLRKSPLTAPKYRKKHSVFIYSEAEPHAKYDIYRRVHSVFYSIYVD